MELVLALKRDCQCTKMLLPMRQLLTRTSSSKNLSKSKISLSLLLFLLIVLNFDQGNPHKQAMPMNH